MATYSYKHQADLDNLLNQSTNYGDYQSEYTDKMNGIMDTLANRQFSYDPNQDETYKQYEESYTRNGQKAAEDTIGKVSARTGGLASSYATSAANQAYNTYMQQLADKIPELKQLAYNMYKDETANLNQQFNNYLNLDQNAQNIWNTNLSNLAKRAGLLMDDRTGDYNIYDTDLQRAMQQQQNDRNYQLALQKAAADKAAADAQAAYWRSLQNQSNNTKTVGYWTGVDTSKDQGKLTYSQGYKDAQNMINNMTKNGKWNPGDVNMWLERYVQGGSITVAEANQLRQMYGAH